MSANPSPSVPPAVAIIGVGMATPVGLSAPETAAAVRAGTARFTESTLRDRWFEPFTIAEVPDEGTPPLAEALATFRLSSREQRLVRLASRPLAECLAPVGTRELPPLPLCLALPETPTRRPLDAAAFLHWLARQAGPLFDPDHSDASHRGRAGGLIAVVQGVATILSGRAEFVLVGGVDTYRDVYVLGALDADTRIKSEANLDGFIPGEGAAFLLLSSEKAAAARGLAVVGRITTTAVGFESGHLYSPEPYRGDGLASLLAQLSQQGAPPRRIAEVYSSMNGESHWAKEWGVGFLRNRPSFDEDLRMHHPADCYGDAGAAAGPLMIGLAALGIRNRYRRSPALVYGSSDRGSRAALVIEAA